MAGLVARDVGRRVLRYAWPPPAGGRPGQPPPRSSSYLRDRLVALPLLTVVAFSTFGFAYADVRGDSAYIRDEYKPALVALADARVSLRIADQEAEKSLSIEGAVKLSGMSDGYRTRITRTTQKLNQAARSDALTTSERQELDVVSGLVVDYANWISYAQLNADVDALRQAGLGYARSILCTKEPPKNGTGRNGTGKAVGHVGSRDHLLPCYPPPAASENTTVVDRITALETSLRARLGDRAGPGALVLAALAVSAVAFVLLAVGLWRAQTFVRHRLHLISWPLWVSLLLLLAVPVLAVDAVYVQRAQGQVTDVATALAEDAGPEQETLAEQHPFKKPEAPVISALDATAAHDLADGRLSALDGVAPWVAPAGLLSAALTGAALYVYRREYVLISRPGVAT
ncbi:hypothetical protein [Streptomyces sp. NPDC059009]|uniref:hypothetical protein n=1 Tax=Streptomyces sp. NPDC059009 TaxID=3346694 RepID=UPI0036A3A7B8